MKRILKSIRHLIRITKYNFFDYIEMIKYVGFHNESFDKISWRLLLLAHSIEKGLGMSNGRKNFAEKKARDLLNMIRLYNEKGGDKEAYQYVEAISVLSEYRDFRISNKLDTEFLKDIDDYKKGVVLYEAGSKELLKSDLKYDYMSFEKLCSIRYSIREFSGENVTDEELKKVFKLVSTAPTACNRQMVKAYVSSDVEKNTKVGQLVPGNKGFQEKIDKYMIITADVSAFDDAEINQWYVNAGIYISFIQLSLTACELGSCIFQWPKNINKDKLIKKMYCIPGNEKIISIIGVGHYVDSFKVLHSKRKKIEEILRIV